MANITLLGLRGTTHMMPPLVASFIKSDEFEKAIQTLDKRTDLKVYLMCQLLQQIALDPLTGDRLEDFMTEMQDEVFFNIRLNRYSNFIGLISLSPEAPQVAQLKDAITSNLSSRMFKAARMHRRMDARLRHITKVAGDKARTAYSAVMVECGGRFTSERDRERADAAYSAIYDNWVERNQRRVRAVSNVACPGFQHGYSEDVASFLYHHLPIQ